MKSLSQGIKKSATSGQEWKPYKACGGGFIKFYGVWLQSI